MLSPSPLPLLPTQADSLRLLDMLRRRREAEWVVPALRAWRVGDRAGRRWMGKLKFSARWGLLSPDQ